MLADLVFEITATSGTGPFTLGGARSADFRTFAAAHAVGSTVYYCCRAGGQWETGKGTLTSATTLARTTVYNGSAGAGVAVNFNAGNKDIYETINSGAMVDMSTLPASGTFADGDKVLVMKADGSLNTILGSIIKAASTGTPPADTTAPTLSTPVGSSTGTTTASGTVSTNEANGTLYYLFSTAASATAAAVKAGASQAVTATGTQSVSTAGLTQATTYYAHFLHRDAAGNDSAVSTSASFVTAAAGDTTAPTLSTPTGTKNGQTAATGTVSTNEANGTLYWLASTSATATAAAVKAAQSQAVSATGAQSVTVSGLTAATTYYLHYLHRDAAGNDSSVATSASFITDAAAAQTQAEKYTTSEAPAPFAPMASTVTRTSGQEYFSLGFYIQIKATPGDGTTPTPSTVKLFWAKRVNAAQAPVVNSDLPAALRWSGTAWPTGVPYSANGGVNAGNVPNSVQSAAVGGDGSNPAVLTAAASLFGGGAAGVYDLVAAFSDGTFDTHPTAVTVS